jgi:Transglutaminase-like enzymes, putative cysteine proteases
VIRGINVTEERRHIFEYALNVPVYIALAVSVAVILSSAGLGSISVLFVICYFLVDITISIVALAAGKEKWDILYMFIAAAFLSLLFRDIVLVTNIFIAFAVAALIYIFRNTRIARFGWALAAVAAVSASIMILGKQLPKYAAVCLVILVIYGAALLLKKDIRYYMSIPLFIGIAAMFIPVSEEPYKWDFVMKTLDGAGKLFGKMKDEAIYFFEGFGSEGFGYTGYSGTGKITPGVKEYAREELSFDYIGKKLPVYLKGKSFTGFSREGMINPEQESDAAGWFAIYMNSLYHAGVDDKEASYFSKIVAADIIYKYLRTSDIIRPLSVLYYENLEDASKKKKKGYSYKVHFIALDTASPYFRRIVEETDPDMPPESYSTISSYVRDVYKIDFKKIMTEEEYLAAVSPKDMSNYLSTATATDRMKTLTDDITRDAETDYEKALRIEKYLRQYEYSTSVDLTDSDNYIDDFLFETGKGYCVHYASSMVMMLRLAGIPARYSVGYYHYDVESIEVMSTEAHAWPEAYISGIGWIAFEPTPVYVTSADLGWGLGAPEEDIESGVDKAAEEKENDYWKEYIPKQDSDNENAATLDKLKDRETALQRKAIIKFLIYAAVLVTAVILFLLIIKLSVYIRYSRLSPEDKLKSNVSHILNVMDDFRKSKRYISLYDYPKMLEDKTLSEKLKHIIEVYARVRFRGDAADEETVQGSRELSKTIKKAISQTT